MESSNNVPVPVAQVATDSEYSPEAVITCFPVDPENQNINDPEAEIEHLCLNADIITTCSLSRTVTILATVDIIISVIYSIENLYFFIPILFAMLGYAGAIKYNKNLSIIYLCYVLLLCFSRLGIFLYLYSKMNAIERQNHIFDFVLISLGFVISIWISKIVYKFVFYLNKLSDYELTSLQLGLIIIDNRPQIFW